MTDFSALADGAQAYGDDPEVVAALREAAGLQVKLDSSQHCYNLLAEHAEKQDAEIAGLQAKLDAAEAGRRCYQFIAGAVLSGTDEADKIASAFPNPYDAFNEAIRVDTERWNFNLEATIQPLKQRLAECERDAQRYQWFRTNRLTPTDEACDEINALPDDDGPALDAAIDAAIQAHKEKG